MKKYKNRVKTAIGNGKQAEVVVAPLNRKQARGQRNAGVKGGKKVVVSKTPVNMVWESGLEVVKSPVTIVVPSSLVNVVSAIEAQIRDSEFSVYVKANMDDVACIVVSEEYYIPDQDVTMASVEYNDPPVDGFNAVLHKHPSGMKVFSSTDDKYINQNFDVSLLWCDKKFVNAIVNYEIRRGVKLQLEGRVVVDDGTTLPSVDVSKIHNNEHMFCGGHYPKMGTAMGGYAEMYGYHVDDNEDEEVWNVFSDDEQKMLALGMV